MFLFVSVACDDECSGLLISDMDRLLRIISDVTLTTPLPPPYKMLYRFENMTEELKVNHVVQCKWGEYTLVISLGGSFRDIREKQCVAQWHPHNSTIPADNKELLHLFVGQHESERRCMKGDSMSKSEVIEKKKMDNKSVLTYARPPVVDRQGDVSA